jgi:NADH dehydrogenase
LVSIKNKNILITGGSGFLGKCLIKLLLDGKANVTLLSRKITKLSDFYKETINGQLNILNGNVLDKKFLKNSIDKVDVVINLCGILYENKSGDFDRVHSDIPAMLGSISTDKKVKSLIHVSALGVSEISESSYSRSKASGERRLLKNFPKGIIIRPSLLYGKGDNFFGQFSDMATISPFLPLISRKTKFQPVFVNDVAQSIINVICKKNNKHNIYEIGGNSAYTFEKLLKILLKIKGIKRFLIPLNPSLMMLPALFLERLPKPPFTVDQMKLLKYDNILKGDFPGLKDLGIEPSDMEEELIKIYSK